MIKMKDIINNENIINKDTKYLIYGLGITGRSVKNYFELNNISYMELDDNCNYFSNNDNCNYFSNNDNCNLKNDNCNLKNDNCNYYLNNYNNINSNMILVKSAGIKNEEPLVKYFKNNNYKIVTDLELFSYFNKDKKTICVTGTCGKSTTCTLLDNLLPNYEVCGNIGIPIFDKIDSDKNLIIECSSYMTEYIDNFKPNYSIILNIYPNHLDHHKTFENYINSKMKLIENTSDYVIYNYDDCYLKYNIENIKKKKPNLKILSYSVYNPIADIYILNDNIYYNEKYICSLSDVPVYFKVFPEDLLASILLSLQFISKDEILNKINSFNSLEHRLELIYNQKGLKIYNDSKSTSLLSLNKTLKAFNEDIYLISGGLTPTYENESDLKIYLNNNVKRIYLTGENQDLFKRVLISNGYNENIIYNYKNLDELVNNLDINVKGVILFSPASQSFDAFDNFEKRGKYFKNLINMKLMY